MVAGLALATQAQYRAEALATFKIVTLETGTELA